MASPSGRACEVTTNRWRWRIASATCARVASTLAIVIVLVGRVLFGRVGRVLFCGPGSTPLRFLLVQITNDLLDAILVCHGFVEPELELRHPPELQAPADLAAEEW